MATALYRRYRPESFAEVIGQDHVTTPLMRALRAGRVGHAYLFSGPRGCGKTTSARILARCLNCAEGPTDTPCGSCDSCRDLSRGGPGSLDVVEIDAASHGGVDDARELRERATFAPARDRFKVFIIDEAHMVTSAGFNALLKLVEEPPEHVKFVFATTEPDKVIGTIRSRTHHYPFRLIPPQVLTPYLQEVCEAESVPVGDGVLPLVVRAGGGSARDTLSVLDQLMAGAAEEGLDQATAIALLGFTDTALLDGAVEAIAAGDAGALYQVTEQVLATGHEPRRFVEDLLERLRDLIVLAAVPDRAQDLLPQIPADDLERMRHQSGLFTPADLSRCGDLVHETLSTMSGATSPRLHLELLAARLVLRGQAAPAPRGADGAVGGPAGASPRGQGAGRDASQDRGQGQPQGGDGSGREAARRIAAERAEAARRARGQQSPQPGRRPERPSTDWPEATAQRGSDPQQRGEQASPPAQDRPSTDGWGAAAPAWDRDDRADGEQARADATGPERTDSTAADRAPAPSQDQDPAPPQQTRADETAPRPDQEQPREEQPEAQPTTGGQGGGLDLDEVRGHWSAILDQLMEIRRATHALVSQNAQVVAVNGSTIVLGFRTEGLVAAFHRGTAAQNIADAARRILHAEVGVEAVVGDGPGGDSGQGGGSGPGGGPGRGPSGGAGTRPSEPGSGPGASRGGAPAQERGPAQDRRPQQDRSAASAAGREAGQSPRWGDQVDAADARSGSSGPRQSSGAPQQGQNRQGQNRQPTGAGLAERMERNAARARGGRPQAAPEDLPPEPDDPYGEPYDDGPPPGEDFYSASPQRPTERQRPDIAERPSAAHDAPRSDGAAAGDPAQTATPQEGAASAESAGIEESAADAGDLLEVEDEGRDTLPVGEPRTFGQAALRRALAEGRVVRSLPASRTPEAAEDAHHGAGSQADAPSDRAERAEDAPVGRAGTQGGAATDAAGGTPVDGGIPGWDRPLERPGADSRGSGAAAPEREAPQAAAGQPVRRSGADLVREAAHASMAAHRRRGASRGQAQPEPAVDDDPTGGASRDDADAEYTARTGRDVIEAVLGGRVLEVIDETGR